MQKENRRIQMTRRLLKEALLELLETERIEKISVRTLCEKANVNRTTFYKYYTSQYDLLSEMETDLLTQINQCVQAKEAKGGLEKKLVFMKENMKLCQILIGNQTDTDFQMKLLNLPGVKQELEQNLHIENVEQKYMREFVVNGSYAIVVRWLKEGCMECPEQMAQIIIEILKASGTHD